MALNSHRDAQSTKASWEFEDAVNLYRVYEERFGTVDAGDILFFEGDALYELKRWPEARDAYRRYLANSPQGQYRLKAGEAVLHAQREELSLDLRGRRADTLAPYALSETDQLDWRPLMLAVFDEYLALAGIDAPDEISETVAFHRALVLSSLEGRR
jgi:hypothetical protein